MKPRAKFCARRQPTRPACSSATLLPVGTYTVEVNGGGFPRHQVSRRGGAHHGNDAHDRSHESEYGEGSCGSAIPSGASQHHGRHHRAIAGCADDHRSSSGNAKLSAVADALRRRIFRFEQRRAVRPRHRYYMHVNGGREDNNNYLIDGITVADYAFGELTYTPLPSPDAIQEFKVSTSLYDATQGRNGGGNINATLKSGTSKLSRRSVGVLPQHRAGRQRLFSGEGRRQAEYFRRRHRRADRSRSQVRLLLLQSSGHAPAQRGFAGNVYQQSQHSLSFRLHDRKSAQP